MDLIELLIEKQKLSNMKGKDFASLYGLSDMQWSRLRNRRRKPWLDFLSEVIRNHPYDTDIRFSVLRYLAERR